MSVIARLLVILVLGGGLTVGAISALSGLGEGLIPPKNRRQAALEQAEQEARGAVRATTAGAGEVAGTGGEAVSRAGESADEAGAKASSAFAAVVGVLVLITVILALLGLLILATRWRDRRRRRYRLYRILPGREETASTAQVRDLLATWSRVMGGRRRRGARLMSGSPSFALWLVAVPREGRPTEIRWFVQIPDEEDLVRSFDGALREAYRDVRLKRVNANPSWARDVVRLKKTRSIPHTLEAPDTQRASDRLSEGFESSLVDGVAGAMSGHLEPSAVQYVLTPAPQAFETLVRFVARIGEPDDEQRVLTRSGSVERNEEQAAALSMTNQPLFFGEIRTAASRYELARDLAMALSGRSFGAAQLTERRPLVRRRIYAERFKGGLGNPLPSWSYGVFSVSEMAGLWRLPTPHLKGVAIERSSVPRIPAPPELPRTDRRELALMGDESGSYLTMDVGDLPYGVGVQGAQGLGKTALLTQLASLGIHQDEPIAVLVVDAKGDLADSVLSIVPEQRTCHVCDFGHPEAGLDLWSASIGDFDARTNVILQGLIDVSRTESDESQILASSKEFIVNSCLATLATADRPSLQHMRTWLSTSDQSIAWRQRQLSEVARHPELVEVSKFYDEFHDRLKKATSAFVQRAAAPHNKLGQLIRGSIDRVLRHPYAIDVDEVIRNREVLIIDGAIGVEREASTVLRFVLQMIHQAIQRQQELPAAERVKVLLIVDEAPVLLTPTVADMMAQDRSAGLMFCAGWQHNGLIENRKVLSSLDGLLGSRFVFRTRDEDARAVSNLFQVSYDDRLASDMAEVRRHRIGPATIMNLPRFRAAATQINAGERTGSYIGETLAMEHNEARIEAHLSAQRRRGGFYPKLLLAPELLEVDRERGRDYDISDSDRATAASIARMRREGGFYDHDHEPVRVRSGEEVRAEGIAVIDPAKAVGTAPSSPGGGDGNGGGKGPSHLRRTPEGSQPSAEERLERDAEAAAVASAATKVEEEHSSGGSVVGPLGSPFKSGVSDFFVELDAFEDASSIDFEKAGEPPSDRRSGKRLANWRAAAATLGVELEADGSLKLPRQAASRRARAEELADKLRPDQIEVLSDLWALGYLTSGQLQAGPFEGKARSTVVPQIAALRAAGLVDVVRVGGRSGSLPFVYRIAEFGFEVGKQALTRNGAAIAEAAEWSPRTGRDARRVLHDLHASAWLMQLRDVARGHVGSYSSEFHSEIKVPREKVDREWRIVELESLGSISESPGGVMREFKPLRPDLTIQLVDVSRPSDGRTEGNLLIEVDRSGHRRKLIEKLQRYDAFYTAWGEATDWVKHAGWPATLFICSDERALRKLLAIGDEILTGHRVMRGRPEVEWPSPARQRILFALERDLHQRSTRCYRVAAHPPRIRQMTSRSKEERETARKMNPFPLEFIPASYLNAPAR